MRAQSHFPIKKQRLGTVAMTRSGRQDSNLRPSAPKAPALPSCATPRYPPILVPEGKVEQSIANKCFST